MGILKSKADKFLVKISVPVLLSTRSLSITKGFQKKINPEAFADSENIKQ